MWQGEDYVEVLNRQELLLARLDPAQLLQTLALGTVAVAAGVVADLQVVTPITLVDVTAQGSRATLFDGPHDLEMLARQGMLAAVARTEAPEDVGHFEGRARRCGNTKGSGHAKGVFDQRNSAAVLRKTPGPGKSKPSPAQSAQIPKKIPAAR